MKFTDLVFDIVLEQEMKNVGLRDKLKELWSQQKPDITNQEVAKLYDDFGKQKEGLTTKNPYVINFLNRFNAPTSTEKFDPKNLTDITKYSYKQIYFLLDDIIGYKESSDDDGFGPIFKQKNVRPKKLNDINDPVVAASKEYWFTKNSFLIIDEGDFRVYRIPDQKTSKVFGYYDEYLSQTVEEYKTANNGRPYMQWCTTRSGDDNLWGSYRNRRTFYFVIDESKSPEIEKNKEKNQYYISALQFDSTLPNGTYRITSIHNTGVDPQFTTQQVLQIYPKMEGHFEKIIPVTYDPVAEMKEETDVVSRISETPNTPYTFSVQSLRNKKAYIDRYKPLSRPESWKVLTDDLKKSYFDLTDNTRYLPGERFNNSEFLKEVISKKQDRNSLISRLNKINFTHNNLKGIGALWSVILSSEYQLFLKCKDYPHIAVYEKRRTASTKRGVGILGIFDSNLGDWTEINGIKYEPEYRFKQNIILVSKDDPDKFVMLSEYTLNGQENTDKAFYAILPDVLSGGSAEAYLISPISKRQFMKDKNLEYHEAYSSEADKDVDSDKPEDVIGYEKPEDGEDTDNKMSPTTDIEQLPN